MPEILTHGGSRALPGGVTKTVYLTLKKQKPGIRGRISTGEAMILYRSAAMAKGEVILCAGAVGSPAILQRSGIGPINTLEQAGVKAIDDWVRENAESCYHLCGTCRMGEEDLAVVDSQCRVRGIDALRVVDASVIPVITNGNINALTIMIAEKAADHILGNALLPVSNAGVWRNPDYKTSQR